MTDKTFYFGMNYNSNGAAIARRIIPRLEEATGDKCTSRWPWSPAHVVQWSSPVCAVTDISDIARAFYVVLAPLVRTARGAHVEMGLAFGLDKPVYLYRPKDMEGTGFDLMCLEVPVAWRDIIEDEAEADRQMHEEIDRSLGRTPPKA